MHPNTKLTPKNHLTFVFGISGCDPQFKSELRRNHWS